ncbi:unnamed protein product [Allacma fusca]|uniref:acid phosphatase n=1 Tax=Allacma fusca TaxID=39272 RepID=A0A8J2PMC8_9HEXA|nr:unnamed protein product [Allacma fusca]
MQLFQLLVLMCFACIFIQANSDISKFPSLISVQVIVRHGDREPDEDFRNPLGELTNNGKKRMYDFGIFLRGKYGKFLNYITSSKSVSILSSDTGRTIESGLLIGLGLSEVTVQKSKFDEGNLYVPFPVRTIPAEIDDFIKTSRICPRFQKLLDESIENYVNDFVERNRRYFTKFAPATGHWIILNKTANSDKINFFVFYQEQAIYNATMGSPLDEVALEAVVNPDLAFKPGYDALRVDSVEKQRLYLGPLFRQLTNTFLAEDKKKLNIYSAHDRVMYTFMLTLGVWQDPKETPPYGSALSVELHETFSGETYLEWWYKNDTGSYLLEIPGCGKPCFFSQFIYQFDQIISGDNDIECQLL